MLQLQNQNRSKSKGDSKQTASSLYLNQKKQSVTVFGNYWEKSTVAAPMARMTNSASRRNAAKQYRPGHIRKETRIRMAMEQMARMEADKEREKEPKHKMTKHHSGKRAESPNNSKAATSGQRKKGKEFTLNIKGTKNAIL